MSASSLEAIHADPWAETFIDLPTLNAKASEAIESRIQEVREGARATPGSLRSSSTVVLGPPGAGKTHLFSRLRRRLGPRAVFVHVRPLVSVPMTPRFVLGEIVKQLAYRTHGVTQLDALVGSLLAHLSGASATFPSTFLAEYQHLPRAERDARLEVAVEAAIAIWQEIDEPYLRRLLQAPFETGPTQRALLAWLSGRDCDSSQLARIGAASSLGEEVALQALRTLSAVAALGAPIVLVMDQLENLIEGSEPSVRLLGYANLAAELVDVLRGLVLVHMALDSEWARGIEPALNLSQRSRLIMRTETLSLPTMREREQLLHLWVDGLAGRGAPYPWPFASGPLARVLAEPGLTPRMLLVECRRALDGGATEDVRPGSVSKSGLPSAPGLEGAWKRCLAAARHAREQADDARVAVDSARLADGLLACGHFLTTANLASSTAGDPVQLVLERGNTSYHLALLHHAHHKGLAAALAKLTASSERTPVIAVRERSRDLPPTWKDTLAKRDTLLRTGRARWVWLENDDVERLLALDALLQGARSGDVTSEGGEPVALSAVVAWARDQLGVSGWAIVRSLLDADDAGAEPRPEAPATEAPSLPPAPAPPKAPPGTGTSVAVAVLRQLRIASLERVVREASRIDPGATRASVLTDLQAGADIRFFGRSIVCVRVRT